MQGNTAETNEPLKKKLRELAKSLGFADVGVSSATPDKNIIPRYRKWIAAGHHGEMDYMERLVDERLTGADHVLAGARSVIVFTASYHDMSVPEQGADINGKVKIARYALGKDYHYVLKDRLNTVIEFLERQLPGNQWRACVDSAPLCERSYAVAAGLGFIGKNGMLISWLSGSFNFLCEIVTTALIEPDQTSPGTCGNCTRCIDACPTNAIVSPAVVDARKCISYLTIEKKTPLTDEESQQTGEWVFGCDICQDVCPYNKSPEPLTIEDFRAGTILQDRESYSTFLEPTSNRQFERRFAGSPVLRAGKRRIQKLVQSKQSEYLGATVDHGPGE